MDKKCPRPFRVGIRIGLVWRGLCVNAGLLESHVFGQPSSQAFCIPLRAPLWCCEGRVLNLLPEAEFCFSGVNDFGGAEIVTIDTKM